ncbi:MAG: hypothetical protein K1W33_01990 [Clostridia bacterium]
MRKKLAVIMIMLVLVAMSLATTVSASSFTATITPNRTTVDESNEVVVTIRVSNLDVGTTGINTFEGVLSYSTQIFETINADSIEGNNGWQPTYNQDNGKIMLYKQGFLNEDADIVQITFKTKTNVTGKSGDIKLSDIKASNTGEKIEASTISTKITVGKNSEGENMANTSGNKTNTNTNTPSRINTTTNTTRNIANNTNTNRNAQSSYIDSTNNTQNTTGDIPYTGVSDNIMRAIFVVLVIAGISYFKYESIKEK